MSTKYIYAKHNEFWKVFYTKLYVVLLHSDCCSLWVSFFDSVDYMYLTVVNWWFVCFWLRSYSNGRTEYAAFSWRTCTWHIRGKPVPHSAHAGGWEYRHLYSVHTVSSILPLFTAPEQTLLLFSLSFVCMYIVLCLEGNRSGVNDHKSTQTQGRYRFWGSVSLGIRNNTMYR